MNRNFSAVLLAACALFGLGCQSTSNPWAGETYRKPSSRTNPPQSTYAPMPSILPSLKANSLETETPDAPAMDVDEPIGF
jgi:hypothetical protein